MVSEFLFKLLNAVAPFDRFGRLVVRGDELVERAFQVRGAEEVIGLQVFALEHTEPDFDLIQPGCIGRQPEHLKVQPSITSPLLCAEPAFELLGSVGGSIIQDEGHRVDFPSQCLRNDCLLYKGLEIGKAFATTARSVDRPISNRQAGKEMAGATTMVACFVEHWLAWACGARRLDPFSCLNGRFLIQTDQPGSFAQERPGLAIGLQHGAGSVQESDGIMDMLPGMVTPRAQTLGFEPASHCTGRDGGKRGVLCDTAGQFGATPAREGHLALPGQARGDGGDLRTHLRGKNASAPHCAGRQLTNAS
jgi:hypothetical protein